jgi:polyhydroxyalkanoate synthesis repressor PhaR
MSDGNASNSPQIELRKYPNRRYYDVTRSRHVTLEEIYSLIRSGRNVHVTDSKTGDDLTAKVLAQIILEHDPPKLGIFPVELLHQLIRTNEPIVRDFVDKYFNQALKAFLVSQHQFDLYLRQAMGLQATLPLGTDWARFMMGPFVPPLFSTGRPSAAVAAVGSPANGSPASGSPAAGQPPDGSALENLPSQANGDLRRTVEELQARVLELQRQLTEKA